MDIGARIDELREKANISPRQLAIQSGLSPSYVLDVISNKSNPTIDKLSKICNTLNISLVDFFAGTNNIQPFVLTPELHQLLENAKELSAEQLTRLSLLLESMLPNRQLIEVKSDGNTYEFVIDKNIKPNGLTDDEIQEVIRLTDRLEELDKKKNNT